jgi:hypothetical protein
VLIRLVRQKDGRHKVTRDALLEVKIDRGRVLTSRAAGWVCLLRPEFNALQEFRCYDVAVVYSNECKRFRQRTPLCANRVTLKVALG